MTDPFKELVVDAICGAGFPTHDLAERYTRHGFATFTGNQWNEAWTWNRPALNQLSLPGLQEMYQSIKEHQQAARDVTNVIAKAAMTTQ